MKPAPRLTGLIQVSLGFSDRELVSGGRKEGGADTRVMQYVTSKGAGTGAVRRPSPCPQPGSESQPRPHPCFLPVHTLGWLKHLGPAPPLD